MSTNVSKCLSVIDTKLIQGFHDKAKLQALDGGQHPHESSIQKQTGTIVGTAKDSLYLIRDLFTSSVKRIW